MLASLWQRQSWLSMEPERSDPLIRRNRSNFVASAAQDLAMTKSLDDQTALLSLFAIPMLFQNICYLGTPSKLPRQLTEGQSIHCCVSCWRPCLSTQASPASSQQIIHLRMQPLTAAPSPRGLFCRLILLLWRLAGWLLLLSFIHIELQTLMLLSIRFTRNGHRSSSRHS